jgi:hypothetical protein
VRNADARRMPECPRETELLESLQTSAWPDCCAADLRDHVAGCSACSELEAIVLPLLDEHHAAVSSAPVPGSGAVWWRAQLRARQEAARRAARPITIAQAIGFACALGIVAGGLTLLAPAFGVWLASVAGSLPSVTWAEVEWLAPVTMAVLLALTMVFVLAPVAVYLAVKED